MGTGWNGDAGVDMKGQVYSLIVVVIMIPLLLFILFYLTTIQSIKYSSIERVIADQMHEVGKSMEEDFSRAVEISCKRAVLSVTNYIVLEGEFMENASAVIAELMNNGTMNGNQSVLMITNTLPDWKNKITDISTGFNTFFNYSKLSLSNYDGIHINVSSILVMNISENLNISKIDRVFEKDVLVSVEGFEDPIFPLNSMGYVKRIIKTYPFRHHAVKIVTGNGNGNCSGNVTFNSTDTGADKILVTHNGSGIAGFGGVVSETADTPAVACYITGASDAINNAGSIVNNSGYMKVYLDDQTDSLWYLPLIEYLDYYSRFNTSGPDFIKRLEGNLSESVNGMETFVIEEPGIPVKVNQSRIDYLYFSNNTYNGNRVRYFPEWFRIDAANAAKYNLTDLVEI